MTTKTAWPFGADADRDDPLTALRIPVTGTHPQWRYIATFDRDSEARPTDAEAAMLASFIDEYKTHWFNEHYQQKLAERTLDVDGGCNTTIFHKWGDGDWSYRRGSWQYGPFWVPVSPRLRNGDLDHKSLPPHTLAQTMDRIRTIADDKPMKRWIDWKAARTEVFGGEA
ncbi:hypothetical protein ACFW81_23840 [Streptomyces angustmyceticus]|uniref:hypothetical protein n=1 Tax=Streptomyces angustmyceticus TaxID=285578 RepID=UPI0036C34B86